MIAGVGLDQLSDYGAGIGTYAGTRLVSLEDGVERGQRVLEMRSGGGLNFDVMVDRSGDIGALTLDGQTLSWHGAGGLKSPWLMDHEGDNGQGFLRGFGGFLNTCGLDHIRQPDRDDQAGVEHPLHGRGTFHPAVLRGHGLVDDVEVPFVFCETEFVQTMAFASALRLRRRIEMPVGGQSFTITDTVRNVGHAPAAHMLLYHFNLGFPLIAEGATINFAGDECVWRSNPHDPLANFPVPEAGADNMISVFKHAEDAGKIEVFNPNAGLRLGIEYPAQNLPYCQLLRMTAQGSYGAGIEPCTTAGRTRNEARDKDEMIMLEPKEERTYALRFTLTNDHNENG